MIRATDIHKSFGTLEVLKGVSLDVAQGEVVSIVGASGAGKTTLIKLLQRFYDVDGGSLRVEGVDVRDWDRAALRGEFAMVLQLSLIHI